MKRTFYSVLAFAAFGLTMTACGGSEPVEDTTANQEVVVEENNYALNTESSKLKWTGYWTLGGENVKNHYGTVDITAGELTEKGDHYAGSFTIDMSTINAEDLAEEAEQKAKLEGHLMADDFFKVDQFAQVNVTLNSISNGVADLTIDALGKKFNQDAPVEVTSEGDQLMIHGSFGVDFSMYDMPMMQTNEEEGNVNPEIQFELHLVVDKK